MIENLVISGGCASYIQTMGIIQEAELTLYNIKNIKSIWAISSGTFIALFISLIKDAEYDWNMINELIINSNIYELFEIDFKNIVNIVKKKGIYDITMLYGFLSPLFKIKNIPIDITLKEFYDKISNVNLFFYSFELNSFSLEEFSWITHPDLKLLEAIYMSCCIPLLFSPIIKTSIDKPKCYIDAGIVNNYPINECLSYIGKENENKVFGINTKNEMKNTTEINKDISFINYMLIFILKILDKIYESNDIEISHQIVTSANYFNYNYTKSAIISSERRKELLEIGRNIFKIESEKWNEKSNNIQIV